MDNKRPIGLAQKNTAGANRRKPAAATAGAGRRIAVHRLGLSLALLFALLGPGAQPAFAQADCAQQQQQCLSGCQIFGRMSRQMVQMCANGCNDRRAQCQQSTRPAEAPPAATSGRDGGPASSDDGGGARRRSGTTRRGPPETPPAAAPQATAPAPAPAVADNASAHAAGSGGDYEGPIRFAPRYAFKDEPGEDRVPLHNHNIRRVGDGVLNNDDAFERLRQPGEPPSLYGEIQALEAAGYQSLECQYGPMRSEGGYTVAAFWKDRRGPMSDALVQKVRKYAGMDVALQDCPATLAEAMRIGSGRQAVPTAAERAAATAELQQRTGMRYVPAMARLTTFDDTRRLHSQRILSPVVLFSADRSNVQVAEQQTRQNAQAGSASAAFEIKLHDAGQMALLCQYVHETAWNPRSGRRLDDLSPASPSSGDLQAVTVRAWYGKRPEAFEPKFFELAEKSDVPVMDVALPRCPATYGMALAAANGSPQALATATQAAESAGLGPAARRRQSDAEDAALVQRLRQDIGSLEDDAASLTPQAFKATVEGRIRPTLRALAGSAMARADALDPKNGRAFDAWDRTHGGPLLTTIHRLYLLAARKAFRWEHEGISVSDFFATGAQQDSEQSQWYRAALSQRFTRNLYHELMDVYARREAVGPLVDTAFFNGARQASRLMPPPQYQPAPRPDAAPRPRETIILYGTPGQIAAAQVGIQVGRSLGEATTQAGAAKAEYAHFSRQIDVARQAFWRCYASRCADGGRLLLAYGAALRDKDLHFMYQPLMQERLMAAAGGSTSRGGPGIFKQLSMFLGAGGVDNGTIMGCESEAGAVTNAVRQSLLGSTSGNVMQDALDGFKTFSETPEYQQWQQCRDRMEFLLRPR